MHKLAIAGHVVEIATRHADGRRVAKVYLEVGLSAGYPLGPLLQL